MSNTYAKIEKELITKKTSGDYSHTDNMTLTLTAFMGGKTGNVLQLTVNNVSTMLSQSGCGFIVLSNEDIDNLIVALQERRNGLISATGYEQSSVIPNDEIT